MNEEMEEIAAKIEEMSGEAMEEVTAILRVVKEMREAQKSYFKRRGNEALLKAIQLENKIDNMIKAYDV